MTVSPVAVLDLRDSPWVDGPGRTVLECAASMDPDRIRMIIATFSSGSAEPGAYAQEAAKRGLTVEVIEERSALDLKVLRRIIQLIDKYQIRIVHTHDFRSDLFGFMAARWRGVSLVGTAHGWISHSLKSRAMNRLDKMLLRNMDRVIAVSGETLSRLGTSMPDGKAVVIANALRTECYRAATEYSTFRDRHGFGGHDLLIANIGRLSPEKGQDLFLRAGRDILERWPSARLLLIGVGPMQPDLHRLAIQFGIADRVHFMGYLEDMRSVYPALDLVVQSSFTEGMPNVVLEALLMELPVVATNVGGTAEIMTHGRHGLLVRPGDVSELEGAIEEVLEDPKRYKEMARSGADRVRSEFDHSRRVERLIEVYQELASQTRMER